METYGNYGNTCKGLEKEMIHLYNFYFQIWKMIAIPYSYSMIAIPVLPTCLLIGMLISFPYAHLSTNLFDVMVFSDLVEID